MKNTCLYFHLKPDGEIFYVGIGNLKRPYSKVRRTKFWWNIVKKYGYEIKIVSENLSWKRACRKEILYIRYYGRRDLGLGNLINQTDGGEGAKGHIISNETKKKLSEALKGKPAHNKGKSLSEETKKKISKNNRQNIEAQRLSHLGKKYKPMSEEGRKNISKSHIGQIPWNKGHKKAQT